ncbi:MAG: GNAT family N-acetyltransferase [Planctomycetota bacterium]|nr:GNAT family N-acetyltransferase [Planctomycetota bacterium]
MKVKFRKFTISDYPAVRSLWKRAGIKLTLSDERSEIARMLKRNPFTCFLAELDGELVGAVMGSWDGRRGFVHHLAVEPEYHLRGIGRAMMEQLEKRFAEMEVVKITFLVENDNIGVVDFYRRLGYVLRDDLTALSKTLRTE